MLRRVGGIYQLCKQFNGLEAFRANHKIEKFELKFASRRRRCFLSVPHWSKLYPFYSATYTLAYFWGLSFSSNFVMPDWSIPQNI